MTKLSVNLNAVAQLRNRRDVGWPSVTKMAEIVLDAEAGGITVHPRPDERHIRRRDVFELRDLVRAYPLAEYNIEGYPTEDFLHLVAEIKPDQVTLVPDDPAQATSDHGWDIAAHKAMLSRVIAQLQDDGMRVSLFIDEDVAVPELAKGVGADRVELYTGPYGATFRLPEGAAHLDNLSVTADAARQLGLGVNAGHDLTLENLPAFIEAVGKVDEVSIGHGITADALIYGFADAVRRYKALLD